MPFAGDPAAATGAVTALRRVEPRDGDELLFVDNGGGAPAVRASGVTVLAAARERSSYHARNVGAQAAGNEFILFIDADCVPDPAILERYFEEPIDPLLGAVAGEISADVGQTSLVARYQRARGHLSQQAYLDDPYRPRAATANLLVRAQAWRSVGGFAEGIRSGGDADFCWRLQEAGWGLGYRPAARVVHRHRETVGELARATARYAAAAAWLRRRHPAARDSAPNGHSSLRALGSSLRALGARDYELAGFRALDALVIVSARAGALTSNRA